MPDNQAYPSVNDFESSWADIALTIQPIEGSVLSTIDFAAVKWSRKVEVGERRGASGGRVMARTTGSVSYEASFTFYRKGYLTLLRTLMATAPSRGTQKRVSLVAFTVTVQHTPIGSTEVFETKIKGCRLLSDSDDMKEGNDADKLELTLNPIEIANIIDGVEVVLL